MKLAAFLEQTGIRRSVFAARIGVSASHVTALCAEPPQWPGRVVAAAIYRETDGAVTPNDFLPAPVADVSAPTEAAE